jgi:serine/threonine-protein kinase
MFCPYCGTQVVKKKYCTQCGTALLKIESPATPTAGVEVKQPFDPRDSSQSLALTLQEPVTLEESITLSGLVLDEKYRLESKIGLGGMGSVYRARRLLIGDTVAVKVLHPNQTTVPQANERFRREAQTAARIKHPNVVNIYDFGVSKDGLIYQVMELAEGESLRQLLEREGTVDEATAVKIIFHVCAALDEAHKQGVVHRDIKPENILVRKTRRGWQVKVLDFGIASQIDPDAERLTITGSVMGTPHYMSPEQCMGEAVDGRSDIYSLGIVLFEILTGVAPFNSTTPTAIAIQQVNQAPPRLRDVNPKISPAIEEVVLHALEKKREARPQTASELAKKLIAAARNLAVTPAPQMTNRQTPGGETSKRHALPTPMASIPSRRAVPIHRDASITVKTSPVNRINHNLVLMFVAMFLTLAVGIGGILLYKHKNGFVQAATEKNAVNFNQQSPIPSPQPAGTEQNTPNQNAVAPEANKPIPTNNNVWEVISDQTIGTVDASNVSDQLDRQAAVIKPGGQLALNYRDGRFFKNGNGDDLLVFGSPEQRVSYIIFVRDCSACVWKRIDTNRGGFPQGVAGHDMGHHGMKQARQVLIKNTGNTDLSINASMIVYEDEVATGGIQAELK